VLRIARANPSPRSACPQPSRVAVIEPVPAVRDPPALAMVPAAHCRASLECLAAGGGAGVGVASFAQSTAPQASDGSPTRHHQRSCPWQPPLPAAPLDSQSARPVFACQPILVALDHRHGSRALTPQPSAPAHVDASGDEGCTSAFSCIGYRSKMQHAWWFCGILHRACDACPEQVVTGAVPRPVARQQSSSSDSRSPWSIGAAQPGGAPHSRTGSHRHSPSEVALDDGDIAAVHRHATGGVAGREQRGGERGQAERRVPDDRLGGGVATQRDLDVRR
jgi:hypothetical protein